MTKTTNNLANEVKKEIITELKNKNMILVRFVFSSEEHVAGVGRSTNGTMGLSRWYFAYDSTDMFEINYERDQNEIWADNCPYPTCELVVPKHN